MTSETKTTRGYNQVIENRLRIGVESIASSLGLTSLNVHEKKAKAELIKSLFNYPCSFGLNDTVSDRQDRMDAIQFVLNTIANISSATVAMHGEKIRYFVPNGMESLTYDEQKEIVLEAKVEKFVNLLPSLETARIAAQAALNDYTERQVMDEYADMQENEFKYLAYVSTTGIPNDFRMMSKVEMSSYETEETETEVE